MPKFQVFYLAKDRQDPHETLRSIGDLNIRIWKPSIFNLRPDQVPFSFVWILYSIIFFLNKEYKGFLVFDKNNELIHHTFVIPYHFRFPFMKKADIQISNVWTKDAYRNLDIATIIINQICHLNKDKAIWYVCRQDNEPSIKVAKKSHFVYIFDCKRFTTFGIPIYCRCL